MLLSPGNNFKEADWHALFLVYNVTESLFLWLNIFSQALVGSGFILLSQIGAARAAGIWSPVLTKLSTAIGVLMLIGFASGVLQEASPFFGIGYYLLGRLVGSRALRPTPLCCAQTSDCAARLFARPVG